MMGSLTVTLIPKMKNKVILILAIFIGCIVMTACMSEKKKLPDCHRIVVKSTIRTSYVCRQDTNDLVIFLPTYKRMDLVCGKRPSIDDTTIVFCAEAAFTGECLDSFIHRNIAGNHVSGGVYYNGYKAKTNTGAFVWYNGKWKFLYKNYAKDMKAAEKYGGMGFGQNMVVYNGQALPLFRKDRPENIYRVLCELNGKLCVVESKNCLAYSEFVKLLIGLNVKNALYLDMGGGWNYSWYRDSAGAVHEIHPQTNGSRYQTNWIVFKN